MIIDKKIFSQLKIDAYGKEEILTDKKKFLQLIIDKKKILTGDHEQKMILTNKNKCMQILHRGVEGGTHQQYSK